MLIKSQDSQERELEDVKVFLYLKRNCNMSLRFRAWNMSTSKYQHNSLLLLHLTI